MTDDGTRATSTPSIEIDLPPATTRPLIATSPGLKAQSDATMSSRTHPRVVARNTATAPIVAPPLVRITNPLVRISNPLPVPLLISEVMMTQILTTWRERAVRLRAAREAPALVTKG